MNRNTTVSLIKEFQALVKNQTLSEMLRVKANDYMQQNLNESDVFTAVLNDIKDLNATLKVDALSETIDRYSKLEKAPAVTVSRMMQECGLSRSIVAIKESNIITDPVIKTVVSRIEESLKKVPEFKFIPSFIESLKPFAYDASIKKAITEASEFMQQNATKLIVLNSIFEMKSVPSNMYNSIVSILEQALLDNNYSADVISMQLRERVDIPTVKTLINDLSHIEGRATGKFNIGVGNNNVLVESVIVPSTKVGQGVMMLLNGYLYTVTESEVRFANETDKGEAVNEFYTFCQNFVRLGFKHTRDSIKASNLRNIELEMKNEGANLNLYLNKQKVSDTKNINYAELFVMENSGTRQFVSNVFENLSYVNSLDFVKLMVSESKSAYLVNLGTETFIVENSSNPTITKMNNVQLHKYVLESFGYDMKSLFENDLNDVEEKVDAIDKKKESIEDNIKKLEESIKTLNDSLAKNLNEEDANKVIDLKFVIEKQINAFKDQYVALEAEKKKLFETQTITQGKNYNINETVRLKDGRAGKVIGADKHAGRYMVRTEDGKVNPYKSSDLD